MSADLDDDSVSEKSQVMDRSSPFVERLNNVCIFIKQMSMYIYILAQ